MKDHLIDDVTKAMASGVSRRRMMKIIGGGLAAFVIAHLGLRPSAADPAPKEPKPKPPKTCNGLPCDSPNKCVKDKANAGVKVCCSEHTDALNGSCCPNGYKAKKDKITGDLLCTEPHHEWCGGDDCGPDEKCDKKTGQCEEKHPSK